MLAHFLGCEGGGEHVGGLGEVACGAVVEADFYLVVVEAVHVSAYFDVGNEVVGILDGYAVAQGELLQFLLLAFFADRFVTHLHLEDVAVDEVAAEQGEDGVRMVAPYFHGRPDVVVVEGEVVLQAFGLAEEGLTVDVVVEEEAEGWGGE